MSILLYGCTPWTLTKRMEKKFDGNYTRGNTPKNSSCWRQQPTKQQLYGHLPPIQKTIQVRRNGHAGNDWRRKGEFISDILPWTPSNGRAKAGRPTRTYIQQLCADIEYILEDLSGAMDDTDRCREKFRVARDDDDNDKIINELSSSKK